MPRQRGVITSHDQQWLRAKVLLFLKKRGIPRSDRSAIAGVLGIGSGGSVHKLLSDTEDINPELFFKVVGTLLNDRPIAQVLDGAVKEAQGAYGKNLPEVTLDDVDIHAETKAIIEENERLRAERDEIKAVLDDLRKMLGQ
jgi:hypothetical protein